MSNEIKFIYRPTKVIRDGWTCAFFEDYAKESEDPFVDDPWKRKGLYIWKQGFKSNWVIREYYLS